MGPGRALGAGLLLLGVLGGAASGLHSLRYYFVTVSDPSPGVPEFEAVGYVDGNPFVHYDSETGKKEPRANWIATNVDRDYWDSQTQVFRDVQEVHHMWLDTLPKQYNQSGRAHTLQRLFGCDLLENNSTTAFSRDAYNGKDFLTFDMDTMTFTAADAGAEITKRQWEDATCSEILKDYLQQTCIEWLRKYVSYGRAVLERREPPTVQVSGKEADSVLTLYCRAYGFYPRPIAVSWLKDGEARDQETQRGGVVPNSDGTYYTWASIEARPEEKDKYRCRVEHASLREPGVFAWEPESSWLAIVLGVAAAVAVMAVAVAVMVLMVQLPLKKYKSGKNKKGYGVASGPDADSGISVPGIPAT